MKSIETLIHDINRNEAPISELVGLHLNRYGYSDINPIGRVTRVIGKHSIEVAIVRPTTEWPINATDLKFEVGGFSAHCLNSFNQSWEFAETGETIKMRVSKAIERNVIPAEKPVKYYDYNF